MWERAQGFQIFKWNSIISILSKALAFLVILLSPHGCRHPNSVPIIPTSSPHHPHSLQKVPMWSPWLWSPWSPPYVVPIVPTSSPHSLHHPHVIPMSSRRSPHHLQLPRYPLNPPPTPLGGGEPQISKNAIRFELIKIF